MGYETGISDPLRAELSEWADLCRLGRNALFTAHGGGFDAHPGTEAAHWQDLTRTSAWPGGVWPVDGPTESLHQVGLMLSNSAGGRFGEMGALLDAGEVAWSLATHSRGILELCAGLFRVYVRPFTPYTTGAVPPAAALQMYASAHLEMIAAAFSGKTLADTYLALDSTDADRQAAAHHAANEVARITSAYGQHYDSATTALTNPRNLRLGGVELGSMTAALDAFAAWMWPDEAVRPQSLYRLFSGHAHSSLDADIQLYIISDQPGRRDLTRTVDRDFIALNVVAAAVIFQRIFARLVGYYSWDEAPLHEYSERLAHVFPDKFSY